MITEIEFEILYSCIKNGKKRNELEERFCKKKFYIDNLKKKNYITLINDTYYLTEAGLKVLEPYKVKNAIIMAAGMASRFAPLSYETPKGLLQVKGEILIEREINQLKQVGIDDITVVVGYLKEKFFYLMDKYGVKIVENNDYARYNNTSTLIRVLDELDNTYICSSDNYFVDNVFDSYVYKSYYSTVFTAGDTDEWCVETNNNDRIISVSIGGNNSWYMLGHVYWNRKFSADFSKILKHEFENIEVKESLWEKLYIKHINSLELFAKHYDINKVLEFDSLDELRDFDRSYLKDTRSDIIKYICQKLKCAENDVKQIIPSKSENNNIVGFTFSVTGNSYYYEYETKKIGDI